MKREIILVLFLAFLFLAAGFQTSNAQAQKTPDHPFRFSRSGLETINPQKMVLLIEFDEYTDEFVKSIGMTEEMVRKDCELRLTQAGIEILSGFQRPEYLHVNVTIRYRSFQIWIQFDRPVLFDVGDLKYMKYGAKTWQKTTLGQHGYAPDYIMERLGNLMDEFIAEYTKINDIKAPER